MQSKALMSIDDMHTLIKMQPTFLGNANVNCKNLLFYGKNILSFFDMESSKQFFRLKIVFREMFGQKTKYL